MAQAARYLGPAGELPGWVPDAARSYLDHTECGLTIRALARRAGCHASTILRQVRKTESRRDDPLVDSLLDTLGAVRRARGSGPEPASKVPSAMTLKMIDDASLKRDATRILSALMRPGALLAVIPQVTTAVVVEEGGDGVPRRIATVEREVAEIMALKEWIGCTPQGKVSRYRITAAGRVALNRFLAEQETVRAGFAEAPSEFGAATAVSPGQFGKDPGQGTRRPGHAGVRRSAGAETPLQVLARRRDKDGALYLTPQLVAAGERLRTDFELVRIGAQPGTMNWDGLMAGAAGTARAAGGGSAAHRQIAARERLTRALRKLGPELGEVALITCCQQRGMEAAEAEMRMPARSGKYVLRIALNMLARHYGNEGGDADLIY